MKILNESPVLYSIICSNTGETISVGGKKYFLTRAEARCARRKATRDNLRIAKASFTRFTVWTPVR